LRNWYQRIQDSAVQRAEGAVTVAPVNTCNAIQQRIEPKMLHSPHCFGQLQFLVSEDNCYSRKSGELTAACRLLDVRKNSHGNDKEYRTVELLDSHVRLLKLSCDAYTHDAVDLENAAVVAAVFYTT
jgi:hypothetical protein